MGQPGWGHTQLNHELGKGERRDRRETYVEEIYRECGQAGKWDTEYDGSEGPVLLKLKLAQIEETWECETVRSVSVVRNKRRYQFLTIIDDVHGELLNSIYAPIQYLLALLPVDIS